MALRRSSRRNSSALTADTPPDDQAPATSGAAEISESTNVAHTIAASVTEQAAVAAPTSTSKGAKRGKQAPPKSTRRSKRIKIQSEEPEDDAREVTAAAPAAQVAAPAPAPVAQPVTKTAPTGQLGAGLPTFKTKLPSTTEQPTAPAPDPGPTATTALTSGSDRDSTVDVALPNFRTVIPRDLQALPATKPANETRPEPTLDEPQVETPDSKVALLSAPSPGPVAASMPTVQATEPETTGPSPRSVPGSKTLASPAPENPTKNSPLARAQPSPLPKSSESRTLLSRGATPLAHATAKTGVSAPTASAASSTPAAQPAAKRPGAGNLFIKKCDRSKAIASATAKTGTSSTPTTKKPDTKTSSGAIDALSFFKTIAPIKSATPAKVATPTSSTPLAKRPSKAKDAPLVSHAEMEKQRAKERAEHVARLRQEQQRDLEQIDKAAFDLLDQMTTMERFEQPFREEVRKRISGSVQNPESRRLPRMSHFGSVFSLYPSKLKTR
ncbi:hypothetical protein OIV83_003201 [Microbotryomycetes sp. JL201]|nr:hypothetical protein OIV83_003201 [Microbotryomycetes sp. JL201]